jgi:hypothetical protein
MTPTSGRVQPDDSTSTVMKEIRSSMVFRVIRPGIQPSQNSTARRANLGDPPQFRATSRSAPGREA